MELSKTFEVLKTILCFLQSCMHMGFCLKSTTFIQRYLYKRMEKVHVNNKFIACEDI